jgi:NAD(P)-dependent dehydrogenase (short-subunit alcohol dehydrogenase family)
MGRLEGKVAVVTGATSGMGLATAQRFAGEGAHVFITGRRQKQLDEAAKIIGPKATPISGDAANLADLDRLYETVRAEEGRIDVLFANAGIVQYNAPLGKITEQDFDQTFGLNVRGVLFTVQKALPLLGEGASVILNGSINASKGFEGFSHYSASKAAVRSFARTWANELRGRKIRVNVISPGAIATAIYEGVPEEIVAHIKSIIPMARMGQPHEIANAALFLASDESSFITGIELFVDGGTAQI